MASEPLRCVDCVLLRTKTATHLVRVLAVFIRHFAKRFAVVGEEGPAEVLFGKDLESPPPEIKNSTAPPSAPGYPIEDGVFNASNQEEDIDLVRNQGLEFDDGMEPSPYTFPLVDTPSANKLFEGQTWVWYGIDCRSVVSKNQN